MALISLDTLATYWKNVSDWVKGTDAVSAPAVKLTGSNVQKITVWNAFVIADGNQYQSTVDADAESLCLVAVNTLNQSVTLYGQLPEISTTSLSVGGGSTADSFIIPTGGRPHLITGDEFRILKGFYSGNIRIVAQCTTPPTSGSLSVFLYKRTGGVV